MAEPIDPKKEPSPGPSSEPTRLDQEPSSHTARSRISFTDRTAAKWALGIAAAALIGLVVSLIGGEGTDLTHVALALAIIAFTLQIGFFAMQLWVASEQDRRSGDLFRQTRTVLTQIETSTEDTVKIIQDQFRFVLEHALGERRLTVTSLLPPEEADASQTDKASVDSVKTEAGTEPVESAADDSLEDLKASMAEVKNKMDAVLRGTQGSAEQQEILRRWDAISRKQVEKANRPGTRIGRDLRSWPNEEIGKQAGLIREKLSPEARVRLDSIARRRLELIDKGDPRPLQAIRVEDPLEPLNELEEAGLVQLKVASDAAGKQQRTTIMTPLGRVVAALSTAIGEIPAWYALATRDVDGPPNSE